MSLITVSNVSKQYKTYTKEKGLSNSIKGLFRREYVVKLFGCSCAAGAAV